MAELLLSAVLPVLFEKLTSPELLNFVTQEGVRSKLNKLKETLELIDSLLIDAERKQLTNGAVRKWLDKLQDWAYDAEDILDEYATEALTRKLKIEEHQASTSRRRRLIPARYVEFTPKALWSDRKMGSKIAGITKGLEDLCKKRTQLGLVEIAGGEPTAPTLQRPTTSSMPTELAIYGRENDKAKIIEMVLNDEPGRDHHVNFEVISIVAMGGVGKTTLAREVYNDEAVNEFNPKGWVCVSDDFNVLKISKAILESLIGRSCDAENLDAVQKKIKEQVVGRKFLLVLDDIWSKSYSKWEVLRSPFMFGAQGSKIIVTTRLDDVASTMGSSSKCHRLKLLSDDECWSLFANHAFDKGDMGAHPSELIRQKVIEKCRGLPLAAKTLGGLLRSKRVYDWLHILDTNICDLQDGEEIPAALLLSYYHLPSHLKKCFAYCALFPKAYQFEENELVFLWITEGLIQQSGGNKQLEDSGGEYFHDLLSRSIFQTSNNNVSRFIMHDLVNDLAQVVSRKISCRWEGKQDLNNESKVSNKARYSSYIRHTYNVKSNFEVFKDAKHLRTHLSFGVGHYDFDSHYISNSVISELLLKFKKLRVLSLQGYRNIELPNSIQGLRLLRYLNLSCSGIRSLPESINSMCNLQTLLLRSCHYFLRLPSDMGNLINLRHLDILGTKSIKEMPLGVSKWKCLRVLSNFIVSKDSGSSLKDLEGLKLLCGEFHISRLEYVTNFQNIGNVILSDKKYLKVLLLEWGFVHESRDVGVESHDEEVLNILKPHQNLEKLTIKGYEGINFSSWVGDSSFSKMTVLELIDCKKCIALPSLGLLSSLKNLTIKRMKEIKNIGSKFYGDIGRSKPFPSLETLCFENLEEWECWYHIQEQENESFSKLQELHIAYCPKLRGRLPNNLTSLKKLEIWECNQLVVLLSNISKLCKMSLSSCKKVVCNSLGDYKSLESMSLIDIFLENPPQGLQSLISLKKLDLANCGTTTLLEGIIQQNAGLEELSINGRESLNFIFRAQLPQSLKKLSITERVVFQLSNANVPIIFNRPSSSSTSLILEEKLNVVPSYVEDLNITYCPSLTCLPIIYQLSATLTRINIWRCSKLTTLSSTGHLPVTLKHLKILDCSKLTNILAEGHLPETLETIEIGACDKLDSIADKFYNNKSLRDIKIAACNNLKSLPKGLETLSSLHEIEIYNCLNFAFFPEVGFPDSNLGVRLHNCPNLKDLPNGIPSLSSLEIGNCPNLSLSEERLPTKLELLIIEGLKHYKAVTKWELNKLTFLRIHGGSDGESFQEEDMKVSLPQTITQLCIEGFPKLKCPSFKDFESLPSLEQLWINNCQELTSLPSLPSSLMSLLIYGSPLFKEACKRDNRKEWAKIADMPNVKINGKFINELEQEA